MDINTFKALAREYIEASERLDDQLNRIQRLTSQGQLQGFFEALTSQEIESLNPDYEPPEFDSERKETKAAVGTPTIKQAVDVATDKGRRTQVPGTSFTFGQLADVQFGLNKLVEWVSAADGRVDPVGLGQTLIRAKRPRELR